MTVNQYDKIPGAGLGRERKLAEDVSRGSLVDAFVHSPDFFSTRTLTLKQLKVI